MVDEPVLPEVILVESEEEPFTQERYEHPLLDVPYQHEPATAGLDYAGELTDEPPAPGAKPQSRKGSSLSR